MSTRAGAPQGGTSEQQAEEVRALGFVLAEWGKAVGDYAASGANPLVRREALAVLEETAARLAIVLSHQWRKSVAQDGGGPVPPP